MKKNYKGHTKNFIAEVAKGKHLGIVLNDLLGESDEAVLKMIEREVDNFLYENTDWTFNTPDNTYKRELNNTEESADILVQLSTSDEVRYYENEVGKEDDLENPAWWIEQVGKEDTKTYRFILTFGRDLESLLEVVVGKDKVVLILYMPFDTMETFAGYVIKQVKDNFEYLD